MFRKLFLNLIILLTGVCVAPLYGTNGETCCSNCLGIGFLTGGYGTFHSFYFRTKDTNLDNDGDDEYFWEYDAAQRAPGGGVFIGYGIPFYAYFNLAFKAAVSGFTSDARHSYFNDSPVLSYTNKMRVKYVIDFSLEPGANIGNRLFLYAKFGASNVGFSQTRQILDKDIPNLVFGEDRQHYHKWGYVLGSGVKVTVTRCMSAFVEHEWHVYPLNIPTRRVANTDDSDESLDYRLTHLHGYGFKFGLMTQF